MRCKPLVGAFALLVLVGIPGVVRPQDLRGAPESDDFAACFILQEVDGRELRRSPAQVCGSPLSPASTFKVPHALAALDSGAISGPAEAMDWDGDESWAPSARRTHTLESAIQNSVVWYFQRIAQRLGIEREREYLRRFSYGNQDPGSGLTTFWLGGSLLITPEEQLDFWRRLYRDELPVSRASAEAVRRMLIEPDGVIVDARGHHPFGAPWPSDAKVSAKTGSTVDRSGRVVRWLVGHVSRAGRQYLFVCAVVGSESLPADAAIELAARSLKTDGVQ